MSSSTTILSTPRNFTPGATHEEQFKIDKDGLDVIHDIYRYAHTGFKTINEDDFNRFKWYGFYRQKPKDSGFFMLRLRLPSGRVTADQLDAIAGISEGLRPRLRDVTTRQTFQYHWLTIEQIPDIHRPAEGREHRDRRRLRRHCPERRRLPRCGHREGRDHRRHRPALGGEQPPLQQPRVLQPPPEGTRSPSPAAASTAPSPTSTASASSAWSGR